MQRWQRMLTGFPLTMQGTSNGSAFSISTMAACSASLSGEPRA